MTDETEHNDYGIIEGFDNQFVGHGLVFGKFMPPTNGHLFFINFAKQSCRKLTILVCSLEDEPIAGEIRYKWMKELFPDCNVVHHYVDIQQEPNGPDDEAFFETWRDSIAKHCPGESFDALFASEPYGYKMAEVMDTRFIPVDVRRDLVQISGTEMRQNPLKNWEHLNPVIRPYFLKRVAIVGPAGSGKTPLAEALGAHFETVYVSNYMDKMSADFADNMKDFDPEKRNLNDISTAARGQLASEAALSRQANKILFTDTELLTLVRKSLKQYGWCPTWVSKQMEKQDYDVYLLVKPGGEGTEPTAEELEEFEWWKTELDKRGKSYAVIDGATPDKRFQNAVIEVYKHVPEMIAPQPSIKSSFGGNSPKK